MIADILAVKNGKVTEDMLLGVLAMYVVPERGVKQTKLQNAWAREGLDPGHLPPGRQSVHVFQEACRSVATGKRGDHATVNLRTEVNADMVSHDSATCVYQITRLVRDQTEQIIDHEKAMTLVFKKDTGEIECVPRDPDSFLALRDLAEKVQEHYDANGETVGGTKVRAAVRSVITGAGGMTLRGRIGGVYFVPRAGYGDIESLTHVLTSLYGDDAQMTAIPWLNTDHTRIVVADAHEEDVKGEVSEMIASIHNKLTGDRTRSKVRPDYVTNMVNRRIELSNRVKEYKALIGRDVEVVTESLSMLDDQIEKLMEAAV